MNNTSYEIVERILASRSCDFLAGCEACPLRHQYCGSQGPALVERAREWLEKR